MLALSYLLAFSVEPLDDQLLPPGAKEAVLEKLQDCDIFPRYVCR